MADNMPSQEEDALKVHSQARSSSDDEGSREHWEEPEDPHPPLPKEHQLASPDPHFVPQDETSTKCPSAISSRGCDDEALEQQVEEVPAQGSTHKRKRGQRSVNKAEGIYEVTALDPKDGEPIEPAGVDAKWRNRCGKVVRDHCKITWQDWRQVPNGRKEDM
ncbi:hypothetical protein PR202_ga28107 [Eleusine coracana subsp. coracana]|uniref:Uncharacterized protein n=1 Tax=Eleusine coracana subsp. coracana TaxID=191504 RepID=A0AAV5DGJ6_ELECO|nr:hypothetical protein PR202_ga28107 [Eleusine coracana subsp. coracana]